MSESQRLTNNDPDTDLPDHEVVQTGTYLAQATNPCGLRMEGTSFVQNMPPAVRAALDLESGIVPEPVVHPEINAVTLIYR